MPHYSQPNAYNYQTPYTQPPSHSANAYYSSPPTNPMPTYYIDPRRSSSRSRHGTTPVVYQTPSVQQYYPIARDYAYSDGGRRRRSSSVGHGGHYSNSYYPPASRSSRSHSHSRSPRDYGTSSSGHHRSHSHSRPVVYYETPHHSGTHHDRRPSVSYSDPGHYHTSSSYPRPHRNSETLGDRFRRWFGGGHHHDSGRFEYVDARTGRPVDKSGRPIYRV
ncbi:hypothetical protein BDY19DRAFT_927774 [Irpex rosettiformis]|uniref:Uncharacterized protein n=1 Tax=Irpex rosettiformis TaxID=378272 RepID=A0ACB8UCF2_9APHY|nr:hypothetical protein BDY19DRAFT_927774 [Irpex rosettiformis]